MMRRAAVLLCMASCLALMGGVAARGGDEGAASVEAARADAIAAPALPTKLSAFALFAGNDPARPRASLRYTLRTPLFSDYAHKDRFAVLPPGQRAQIAANGTIEWPVGTILVKSFGWPDHKDGHPVETRLLIHRSDGWLALPYIWDADGRDATLALGGRRIDVRFTAPDGTAHAIRYGVPNKNQCKECHSLNGTVVPIGPKAANFVAMADAAALSAWFDNPAALAPTMPRWDQPGDGSVADRARAYLDVNCAHCHNPAGSASNSGLFLRWTDPVNVNYGIEKRPTAAGRGSGGMDFAIAPGDPDRSFLLYRLDHLEAGIAMPEVGRSTVHVEGSALLREWIAQMPPSGQGGAR